MMDWTDRHCRFFLRQFSLDVLLYTEMIHAAAILRGDAMRLLRYSPEEQPLAVQLGGSDPAQLAAAARIAADAGYCEVNLNCGCPSDKVQAGEFGACLMHRPALVAECVAAMKCAVRVPVTVKYRVGVVDHARAGLSATQAALGFDATDAAALDDFTRALIAAGADRLIVHARKAVLGGLSPHENRTVPPLRFDVAAALHAAYPDVPMAVNGGLRTAAEVLRALQEFDGVMIGREAYHRPWLLLELQGALAGREFDAAIELPRILVAMQDYAAREQAGGTRLHAITRHMLGLLAGRSGAKELRQLLSAEVQNGTPAGEVFKRAKAIAAKAA